MIGLIVIILGAVIAVVYTLGSIVDLLVGIDLTSAIIGVDLLSWPLFVVAPLWLIVILICVIMIWIGWSMLTTPAPVPLEELEEELAAEEAAEKKEPAKKA